jgi:hypothetical protein
MPKRKYKNFAKPIPKCTFYRNKTEIGSQLSQFSSKAKSFKFHEPEIYVESLKETAEIRYDFATGSENFQDNDDNFLPINDEIALPTDETYSKIDLAGAIIALFFSGN